MTLSELADRVEAATGPDSGLDAEIGRFAIAGFLGHVPDEPQWGCAKFTESLDAAMTLHTAGDEFGLHYCRMGLDMGGRNWRAHSGKHRGRGRTPALALCAAALRAIEKAKL